MAKAPKITIDELEAKYPLYCKALKLLVKDDRGRRRSSAPSAGTVFACCTAHCRAATNRRST